MVKFFFKLALIEWKRDRPIEPQKLHVPVVKRRSQITLLPCAGNNSYTKTFQTASRFNWDSKEQKPPCNDFRKFFDQASTFRIKYICLKSPLGYMTLRVMLVLFLFFRDGCPWPLAAKWSRSGHKVGQIQSKTFRVSLKKQGNLKTI